MTAQLHDLFPSPQTATGARFDELWAIWFNKSKKPLAKAKYDAILAGLKTRTLDRDSGQFVEIELEATEEQIIAGAKAYMKSQLDLNTYRMKDGGKYVPMLSTWLNGGRYLDLL